MLVGDHFSILFMHLVLPIFPFLSNDAFAYSAVVLSAGQTCSQNPKGSSLPYSHEHKIFLMHRHIC